MRNINSCNGGTYTKPLRHHPPSTDQDSNQDKQRQDASTGLVTSGDVIKPDHGVRRFRTSVGVAGRKTASLLCSGTRCARVEQTLHNLQGSHLFANAEAPVVLAIVDPAETAGRLVSAADALFGGSLGGSLQERIDLGTGPGRDNSRVSHPAGEVGLEGALVNITFAVVLASNLDHDVVVEEYTGSFDDAVESALPHVVLGLATLAGSTRNAS
jgi:hypothetical protein